MLQSKRKVAGIIAAVATIFSALVIASPASAAPVKPTITATLNGTSLAVNVAAGSGTARDTIRFVYKRSTTSSFPAYDDATYGYQINGLSDNSAQSHTFAVTAGYSYDVEVQAGTSGSYSNWAYASVTVPTVPAAAPTVVTTATDYQMTVSWVQDPDLSTGDYAAAKVYVYRDGATTAYATVDAADGSTAHVNYTGTSGHSYSFQVKTQNSSGYSALSAASDIVTPNLGTLPGALEDVAASTDHGIDYGNGEIRVTWTDPTHNAGTLHKVKVEYKLATDTWGSSHVYTHDYPGGDTVVINSSDLVPGSAYSIRVSASLNSATPFTYGATVELATTVIPLTRPGAVTNLNATPSDSSVSLTWTAPTGAATGGTPITNYYVDYRLASATSWSSATTVATNSTDASATVTGLTNGTAYLLRVRAVNAEGDDQTGVATATSVTPNPLPGAPANLLGSAANSSVSLGWTAPLASDLHGQTISDYKVEYRPSTSSTWATFAHTASATPSILVTGLANGIAYYFRVSTKTSAGLSTAVVTSATVTPTNSLGSPAIGQVATTLSAGSVLILDNQSNLGAISVPTATSGLFRASAAGVLASFKALDNLGYPLPLNLSNQLVVYAGQKVNVTATGFKAGSRARLYVSGTSNSIGTALADANGKVTITAALPAGLTKEVHVLQLNGSSVLNNLLSASIGVNAAGSLLVTSKSVKFAFGSTSLTSTEKHKLREFVNSTTLTPVALRVVANTYGKATSADKKRATARAKAVAAYLKSLGVVATFATTNNAGKAKSLTTARNVVVTVESTIN